MRYPTPALALAALLSAVSAAPSAQQPLSAPLVPKAQESLLKPEFELWAKALLGEWGVPGAAVGVIKVGEDGEVQTEFVNVGTAGRGRAVTEDTLFGIASNSKAFTAAAVGQLVDAGLVNWTTPVSSLLPSFGLHDSFGNSRVMIKDILSHRTGLPRHDHSYRKGMSHASLVGSIKYLLPSTGFREEYQYNNQMFMTAAYLVSQLRGNLFTQAVEDHIFRPLNMSATTYAPHLQDPTLARVSSSYATLENNTFLEIAYPLNATGEELQMDAGAGGVVTSTRDALKWVRFLLRQRKAATSEAVEPHAWDKILSPSSLLEMSSGHMIASHRGAYAESSATLYGFGLEVSHYQGHEIIRHGGSIPGFGTQIVWSSELGVGTVAFCNTAGAGNSLSDILSYRAFDQATGLVEVDWNARYRKKEDGALAARVAAQDSSSSLDEATGDALPLPLGVYADAAYGQVTVCSLPEFATAPLAPACESLYARMDRVLPSYLVQPLEPRESALLISTANFFGATHIGLRYSGEKGVWKGQWQDVFDIITDEGDKEKIMVGEGLNDAVEVRFVEGGMEWSGVWGAGAGVTAIPHQTEVSFKKL